MLDLTRVTLIAVDNTTRVTNTIKAIHTCIEQAKFGSVKLITSREIIDQYSEELSKDNIIMEEMVYPITNIVIYSHYFLYDLYRHVDTEFCLTIQDHGFIINPESWTEEFFNYDYIGAPWPIRDDAYITPFNEHIRVGNGGFSLRSKKLLEVPLKIEIPFDTTKGDFYKHFNQNCFNEDGNICIHNKHLYESQGCKFPSVELAARFSYESPVPENQNLIPFGFHSSLPPGIVIEDPCPNIHIST
jgi:hypothetical protein